MFLARWALTAASRCWNRCADQAHFVLEAAEIALGLLPGRSRGFAFQRFANYDAAAFATMNAAPAPRDLSLRFLGFDRDPARSA